MSRKLTGKSDRIAGSLIKDILSGRHRVTERLPSERDLAASFDTSRGAVRESMKKLEQLGLVDVQPGGARVRDRSEASVDVIRHLLDQSDAPDIQLIDQCVILIDGLMSVAAEQTLRHASTSEIAEIRELARALADGVDDEDTHVLARFELMHSMMVASRNLPLQLVSNSLLDQLRPQLLSLAPYFETDYEAWSKLALQLDRAIEQEDSVALRASISGISDLNRTTLKHAYESVMALEA